MTKAVRHQSATVETEPSAMSSFVTLKLQLPSKVAIKEGWGTLPEVTERAMREMK